MTAKPSNLLKAALRLSAQDRQYLLEQLQAARSEEELSVREAVVPYQSHPMRFVTVALPDDLAQQARDAGLLGSEALENLLRSALQTQDLNPISTPREGRRLVEKDGLLVAAALPGEKRITTEAVRQILNDMEW